MVAGKASVILKRPLSAAPSMASAGNRALAVVMVALTMGLFFLSDDHRYGVPFLREMIIAISFLITVYVLLQRRDELDAGDWYLLVLAGMVFLIPPVFAYLHYHQPLFFGFLEERRSLLYLTYFLLMVVVFGRKPFAEQDMEDILKYLFYLTLIWSAANAFELIPRHSGFSFSVRSEHFAEGFRSDDSRYATRFLEASFLAALYPLFLFVRGQFKKLIFPLLLFVIYMIFINQTRSMAFSIFLVFVFSLIIRQRNDKLNVSMLILLPGITILGYSAYYLYAYATEQWVVFYDYYRNREFHLVFEAVVNDFLMPHGGLSLQFNQGLRSVLGFDVFISDVGVVGLFFKYGFLFFPLVYLMLMLVYFLYGKYKNDFSVLLIAWVLANFVILPFSDLLGRGTEIMALLIALIRLQGVQHGHQYIACVRRGRPS